MQINGTFATVVMSNNKPYALFVNKNNSIVDVREILGKKDDEYIFADVRPEHQVIHHPDSFEKDAIIDLYYQYYGQQVSF
jgi:hypothetical protein